MRVSVLALLAVGATAFQQPAFVTRSVRLSMADAVVEEEAVAEEPVVTPKPAASGLTMKTVRSMVDNLTKENFAESLATIEPFLLHEAGSSIYAKSMKRIARNAKVLGVEVPEKYAFEADCTASRRAKQDEFIQTKEAERIEAEAAAAEEAAAAAEEEVVEEVPEPVAA